MLILGFRLQHGLRSLYAIYLQSKNQTLQKLHLYGKEEIDGSGVVFKETCDGETQQA